MPGRDVVLLEEILDGQRVLSFTVEGLAETGWQPLASGKSIGHKRIIPIAAVSPFSKIRLTCQEAKDTPIIRELSVYTK